MKDCYFASLKRIYTYLRVFWRDFCFRKAYKKAKSWIIYDWKNNRFLFLTESINMITNVFCGFYLAFWSPNINWILLYTSYTIGSIACIMFSIRRKTLQLLIVNSVFVVTNLYALIKFILR